MQLRRRYAETSPRRLRETPLSVCGAALTPLPEGALLGRCHAQLRHAVDQLHEQTEETALDRLMRSGVSRDEALSRLGTQLPVGEKMAKSDYLIDNNGTEGQTLQQVEAVFNALRGEMEKTRPIARAE